MEYKRSKEAVESYLEKKGIKYANESDTAYLYNFQLCEFAFEVSPENIGESVSGLDFINGILDEQLVDMLTCLFLCFKKETVSEETARQIWRIQKPFLEFLGYRAGKYHLVKAIDNHSKAGIFSDAQNWFKRLKAERALFRASSNHYTS